MALLQPISLSSPVLCAALCNFVVKDERKVLLRNAPKMKNIFNDSSDFSETCIAGLINCEICYCPP